MQPIIHALRYIKVTPVRLLQKLFSPCPALFRSSNMHVRIALLSVLAVTLLFNPAAAACEDQSPPYFPCTTPNNEQAYCINLFDCPVLKEAVSSTDPSVMDFVKRSACGTGKELTVCCGPSASYRPPPSSQTPAPQPPEESHRDFVVRKLLPTRKYCGLQHTDDRIYNSTETALDEFPWLVDVKWYSQEYETDYQERCNGVLISNRYVLTDYLCGFHATKVKLGQHVTGMNVTCIDDPLLPECTEPVLEVKIEEKFRWNVPSKSGDYNFVLIRLAQRINYSDFVRPICLPVDEDVRDRKPSSLLFSGWGSTDSAGATKKRLSYDVAADAVCYNLSQFLEGNIRSAKVELVCLQVQPGNTEQACNGDHGAPLMYSYKHQWFARGILISVFADQGSNSCSSDRAVNGIGITPEVVEWILSNMRE